MKRTGMIIAILGITLSAMAQVDSTKILKDSLSDEAIRLRSKEKVVRQKEKVQHFINKTSDNVADTAEGIGKKVSKAFKRTKKKIQGAVDALKEN